MAASARRQRRNEAARPVWWNTPKNVSRPLAVLYLHLGKTGGGSLVQWLLRLAPGFTVRLDYSRSRLFVALHQDLISDLHSPWELNGGRVRVGIPFGVL